MNFKDFISPFFFIVGFSLYGMESDKPAAHVITYKNGQPEERIAINQETLTILKQSQTITDYLADLKNNDNFDSKNIEIHLPSLSQEDYKFVFPYLKFAHYHTLPALPKNVDLSKLIRLYIIADFLDVRSLHEKIKLRLKWSDFDIQNFEPNNNQNKLLKIPQFILNTLRNDIEQSYNNSFFSDKLRPVIMSLCSQRIKDTLRKPDENSTTFLSRLKSSFSRDPKDPQGPKYPYNSIQRTIFNNDGSRLASLFGNMVNIWDMNTYQLITTLEHDNMHMTPSMHFSPEGNFLVTHPAEYTAEYTYVWNINTKQCLKIPGHDKQSLFSPNEKFFIKSSQNYATIYDLETGKNYPLKDFKPDRLSKLTFTFDDQFLISLCNETIKIWDTKIWECIKTFSQCDNFKVIPGNLLAIRRDDNNYNYTNELLDIQTNRCIEILTKNSSANLNFDFITANKNQQRLAVYTDDRTIKVYDTQTKNVISTITDVPDITYLKFNLQGTFIIARNFRNYESDKTFIWDIITKRLVYSKPDSVLFSLSRDDEYLPAYTETMLIYNIAKGKFAPIALWDIKNAKYLYYLEKNPNRYWIPNKMSADGTLLFTVGRDIIWDITTGKYIQAKSALATTDKLVACSVEPIDNESKYTDIIDLKKVQQYFSAGSSLSLQQKFLLNWVWRVKKDYNSYYRYVYDLSAHGLTTRMISEIEIYDNTPKTIEHVLNDYLGQTSEDVRTVLNKTFDASLKTPKPYQPLTDLANTAKKTYLLSTFKKK